MDLGNLLHLNANQDRSILRDVCEKLDFLVDITYWYGRIYIWASVDCSQDWRGPHHLNKLKQFRHRVEHT